jgi:hypothetical protein
MFDPYYVADPLAVPAGGPGQSEKVFMHGRAWSGRGVSRVFERGRTQARINGR